MCDKGCLELREEFRCAKFGVGHNSPHLFVIPQCLKSKFYIFWVVFWALFYISTLTFEIIYNIDEGAFYFIYLTNWSYLVQSAFVFTDLTVTIYVNVCRKDIVRGKADSTTWYIKVLWVLFNINNSVAPMVTMLYYTLLSPVYTHGSVNTHMLNTVYVILTVIFCAKPVQLVHVYQPMVYGIAYMIFTLIYHATGSDPVYSVLDWSKAGTTSWIVLLSIFVAIPVMHLIVFALYTFRIWLSDKCSCTGNTRTDEKLVNEPNSKTNAEDATTVSTRGNTLPPIPAKRSPKNSVSPEQTKF